MIKMKKAICILLSVILLAGMFAFSGFAAEQNAVFTVTPSAAQVAVGETVTVTVSATTDYYAATTAVPVYYDAALFDLVPDSVVAADIFGAGATRTVINTAEDGSVSVSFTPDSRNTQNIMPTAQILNNTTLFTFQLTAKGTGISLIALKAEDQKTESAAGPLYCGAYASSDTTSAVTMVGQNFTFANAEVTVCSVTAPELQLSEAGLANGAVIDRVSLCSNGAGFIYGINTDMGESIEDALTTPAGSIRVTENEMGVFSTGAVIELLDNSGNVLETYYFIFFGDVNGDGWVDATDASSVEGIASYSDFDYAAGDGSLMGMAADINGDGWIDATDASYVEGVASYSDFPTQAETAATVAEMKGI